MYRAGLRETMPSGAPMKLWAGLLVYPGVAVLSWLATYASFHTPALENVRLGLTYVVIVAAAILWGWGPALAGLVAGVAAFRMYRPLPPHAGHLTLDRLVPIGVILLVGIEIFILMWRSHSVERRLRVAMDELKDSSEALLQAQQASESAAWTFDLATSTIRWFGGGAAVFGRPNPAVQSFQSLVELIAEEDRAAVTAAMERTERSGETLAVEYRVVWPNGEVHWCEARGTPTEGNPNVWRGVTLDITDRKRAYAALVQTEKLAVAGRLAAAIAHEINNPLEAITNLCFLARNTADEQTGHYIAMAEEELRRVAQITSQTLRFHRQQSAATETDLAEMIQSILTMYDARLRREKVLVTMTVRPAPKLVCFAGEIRQVLANVIGNALDALPEEGELKIRIRPVTVWQNGASALRITVADNGHGIPREVLDHIYEPFFTTKTDVGTGLGLWVSASLIEKHGGTMWVRSDTGPQRHGTVFSVVLPYGLTASSAVRHSAGFRDSQPAG